MLARWYVRQHWTLLHKPHYIDLLICRILLFNVNWICSDRCAFEWDRAWVLVGSPRDAELLRVRWDASARLLRETWWCSSISGAHRASCACACWWIRALLQNPREGEREWERRERERLASRSNEIGYFLAVWPWQRKDDLKVESDIMSYICMIVVLTLCRIPMPIANQTCIYTYRF